MTQSIVGHFRLALQASNHKRQRGTFTHGRHTLGAGAAANLVKRQHGMMMMDPESYGGCLTFSITFAQTHIFSRLIAMVLTQSL